MSKASSEFTVFTEGFGQAENKLILTILKLSAKRPRQYIHSTAAFEQRDIVIVNGNSKESQKYQDPNYRGCPVLFVGGEHNGAGFKIERPVAPTKLLKVLDDITVKVLEYVPEVLSSAHKKAEKQGLRQSGDPQSSQQKHDGISRGYAVLIVDDSRPVRQAIKAKMLELNINAIATDSGEKALEIISKRRFDLIFLDIDLPEKNGYQICKEIRANKESKFIPVCMLTGKGSPIDKIKGKMSGCSSYLTKPVTVRELLDVIYKHIPKLSHLGSLA